LHPQRKTGKASGFRSARQFPWTKEEDALLGKLTDRDVAEKLIHALSGVLDRRKFLGKPAVGRAPQRSAWNASRAMVTRGCLSLDEIRNCVPSSVGLQTDSHPTPPWLVARSGNNNPN